MQETLLRCIEILVGEVRQHRPLDGDVIATLLQEAAAKHSKSQEPRGGLLIANREAKAIVVQKVDGMKKDRKRQRGYHYKKSEEWASPQFPLRGRRIASPPSFA